MKTTAAVLLLGVTTAAAAATKKPIHVPPGTTTPLAVSKIIYRPTGEYAVSFAPESYVLTLTEELRRLGYNAVGYENLMFGVDKSGAAQSALGATIEKFNCDVSQRTGTYVCHLAMEWQLYDLMRQQIVYTTATRAFLIHNRKQGILTEKSAHQMMVRALHSLLSRPRFIELLKRKADRIAEAAPLQTIGKYKSCNTKTGRLPKGLAAAQNAAVLIKTASGEGSGVVISEDGYILTADHVVSGQKQVTVQTRSGKTGIAVVVRNDVLQDVALLKTSLPLPACLDIAGGLPETGDEVYVIGAQLGEKFGASVTKGIISGLRETNNAVFLQTDASVNAGNSGGPLLNAEGRVIGIISWKIVGTAVEGLAFASPAHLGLIRMGLTAGAESNVPEAVHGSADIAAAGFEIDPADPIPQEVCTGDNACFTTVELLDANKGK